MKRFSKILVAVLALCLLVGALALAISANTGVEGKFVVQGTGYETWEDALAAANNTHTIYINEDLELDTGITLSGETTDVKVNLNGKTVSTKDDSMLFNVHTSAKLTIEGEGTINNAGAVAIGATSKGVVTVNATGKGIVINNSEVETDSTVMSTFRVYDGSTLNVSGFITVNAYNGSRVVFNVASADKTPGAAALNITDAKVLVPLPSKTPENTTPWSVAQMISLTDNIDVKITDSDLELYYGTLIYTNGSNSMKTITAYKGTDADANAWKDTAAQGIVIDEANINIVAKNTRFFSDYGKYSEKMHAQNHNIGAGIMAVTGKIDAKFDNCSFYADWRPFTSNGNITGKTINQHQLLFTDCHFDHSPGDNNSAQFFIYAVNYKILGGTFSHTSGISAGSFYYLPLEDSEGNPNGKWIGGYMNNTLVNTARTFKTTGVADGWDDSTYVEPDSLKTQTIKLDINGTTCTFAAGYFTDTDKYNAIVEAGKNTGVTVSDNYLFGSFNGDGITATGDFKQTSAGATGTIAKTNFSFGAPSAGEISSVLANGNGYVKFANVKSSSYGYFQTPTTGGSIITNDAFVVEFEVSTDTEHYNIIDWAFQGREQMPRYDKDGNYIGYSDTGLVIGNRDYTPSFTTSINSNNTFSFNSQKAALNAESGAWNKITIIIDFEDTGVLEEIEVPVYAKNGTKNKDGKEIFDLVPNQTVKVKATKLTKYDVHAYVNGVYLSTVSFKLSDIGYNGYIPEGHENDFYIDGLRMTYSDTAGVENTTCFDNVRILTYSDAQKVDLCYLDANGTPKSRINGIDFGKMVAEVDGVKYTSEAGAIAAIKEGSTVKLLNNIDSLIDANVSFKLEPNGFTFPGFVSATHTPVDYLGGFGYIKLVPASASELYTVNYSYNGKDATQTVAKGTVIPAMEEYFPAISDGEKLLAVDSWTVPEKVNDYALAGNVITAVAVVVEKDAAAVAGDVIYETFEDAIADLHGEPIKLLKDITIDALDGVTASTYVTVGATSKTGVPVGVNVASGANITIDFNGKTVTQNFEGVLFNVTNGTLTLTGAATFNNVGTFARATGENSKVVVEATGDGFCVNEFVSAGGIYNVFVAEGKADLAVSGKIAINNAYNTILFKVSGSDTIEFNNADVVNDGPTATQGALPSVFLYMGDGVTVNIESSKLRVNCGDMFKAGGADKSFSIASKLKEGLLYADEQYVVDGIVQDVYFPEFTASITANNSEIIASEGAPGSPDQTAIGGLFRINETALKVVMNNCDLVGSNRVFDAGTRPYSSKKVSPNQFIFNNVNYTEVASVVGGGGYSSNVLQENINIIWNGGNLKAFDLGCSFVPMIVENGVIGAHLFNTNVKEGVGGKWDVPPTSAWTAYYISYQNAIALVDGTVCKTEADVKAAIKDGSKVMLLKEANISADKAFDVYTSNGYIPAGIVSATHKAVVDAKGNVKVSAASANEIFTINYAFGGKTATQTAALGTVIATPEGISERFFNETNKKLELLKGWTLVEGEDVVVVTGNANAIAKYDSVDPVIVYWTTADGETVIDTDYYIPGEYTTLPEFNGEDIKPDHSADYYSIVRTGWDGVDAVKLDVADEYTVKAVMSKVAPDTFPGLKYNFTLYAYHVLNFYIPQNMEGVEFVGVSTVKDGSAKFTAMGSGTLENKPYNRYSYILGAADTGLKNYYIVYNVDGVKLSFEVQNIGVPSYSVQVMKDYESKVDEKSVAAKTLIVNMANYADKVLTVTNGDKTTPGAMAYTYILNTYGAQYLTRYNSLTNDKFLEGGEIYKADGVADLNWILYHDGDASNDDAANAEALSFIKGISFVFDTYEPKFIMEYSDAAIAVGIQRPSGSNGSTGAHPAGLHAYTGFGDGNGTQAYAKQWAQDASGKVYNNASDIWYTGVKNAETGKFDGVNHCDATKYDYFFSGDNYGALNTNTYWNVHKLADISEKFTIRLEIEGNDNGSAAGTFEETGDRTVGYVYYNLAAYINSMMDAEGEAEANAAYIEAAKALYAYSEAAAAYKAQ